MSRLFEGRLARTGAFAAVFAGTVAAGAACGNGEAAPMSTPGIAHASPEVTNTWSEAPVTEAPTIVPVPEYTILAPTTEPESSSPTSIPNKLIDPSKLAVACTFTMGEAHPYHSQANVAVVEGEGAVIMHDQYKIGLQPGIHDLSNIPINKESASYKLDGNWTDWVEGVELPKDTTIKLYNNDSNLILGIAAPSGPSLDVECGTGNPATVIRRRGD